MKAINVLGTSFTALTTFLFVICKLTGFIAWHWLWVLSPVWIFWGLATILYVALFCFVIYREAKVNAQMNEELKKIYGDEYTTK